MGTTTTTEWDVLYDNEPLGSGAFSTREGALAYIEAGVKAGNDPDRYAVTFRTVTRTETERRPDADTMLSENAASRKNGGVALWMDEDVIQAFEAEGMTTSDAQAALDAAALDVADADRLRLLEASDADGRHVFEPGSDPAFCKCGEHRGEGLHTFAPERDFFAEPYGSVEGEETAEELRANDYRAGLEGTPTAALRIALRSLESSEERAGGTGGAWKVDALRAEIDSRPDPEQTGERDDDYLDGYRVGEALSMLEEDRSEWYYRGYESGVQHRADRAVQDARSAAERARDELEWKASVALEEGTR